MKGYDFHRQKPIQRYIVDFFCHELMLAIEIDGVTHNEKIDYDIQRQKQIELLGIQFLRFTDEDIKGNLAGVLEKIEIWIDDQHTSARGGTPF